MNTIKMIGKLLLSVAVYAGICFGNVANANENGVILNSALVADDYDYILTPRSSCPIKDVYYTR